MSLRWSFGIVGLVCRHLKASVFGDMGNRESHELGMRLKNLLFIQIAPLNDDLFTNSKPPVLQSMPLLLVTQNLVFRIKIPDQAWKIVRSHPVY